MKAINFRIDSFLKEKLGILQKAYSSANISDTLRNLLNKTIDREIEQHCYQFPPSLPVIARKIELGRLLNHEEISLLGRLSRYAYMMQLHKQDYVNPDYLLDYIAILEAVLPYTTGIESSDRYHYIFKKLPFDVPQKIKNKENYSIYDAIAYNKKRLIDQTDTHVAEYASRCVSTIFEEEFSKINIFLINNVIKPYLTSLLILAKKGYVLENKHPAFHYLDLPLFVHNYFGEYNYHASPYIIFQSKLFEIKIKPGIELSSYIGFKDNDSDDKSLFLTFNFPELNDLIHLLTYKDKFPGKFTWNSEYFSFIQGTDSKNGWLNYQKISVWLTSTMYDDLKKLLFSVFDKYKSAFLALRIQWGDI